MAVSETISLLISVLISAARSDLSSSLLSTTEMIKSFPEDTELTLLLEKNVFSLNVSNQNYLFSKILFFVRLKLICIQMCQPFWCMLITKSS